MDKVKNQFDKKRIITFILITYTISWMIWMPNLLNYHFNIGNSHSNWLHILGGLGPLLGAIITILIFDKTEGLKTYFKERFLTITNPKWILIGLFMPTTFFFIAYFLIALFSREWTQLSLIGLNSKVPYTNTLIIWILWCFFYGFGEEGGWRGYLFPELTKKYKTRISTFYTALIWATWHLPLLFYDKNFISMGIGGTIGWLIGLIFGSLLLGWLTKQSNWSLWPAILFHGTFNLFTTSENLNPLLPALMRMMVIIVALGRARKYGEDLSF